MTVVEQELIQLNRQIGDAELKGDTEFLKQQLADGLRFRRANGKVVDKRTYLEDLESPDNSYDYLHSEDVEVLSYGGDVALVSLRVQAKGKRAGKSFEGVYRNTRLFERRHGKWQCALWFNTPAEHP